jgi:hypothetical protein
MQSTAAAPAALAAPAARPARAGRRAAAAPRAAAAAPSAWAPSRRALAAALLAAPAALLAAAPPARALIPDDDDEELLEKARANRKGRLAAEKAAEKEFAAAGGYVDRRLQRELAEVQVAVNALGATGAALAGGDAAGAAAGLSEAWVADLRRAASALSASPGAKAAYGDLATAIGELKGAAEGGRVADAKAAYVGAVGALGAWAGAAGVAGGLKGL